MRDARSMITRLSGVGAACAAAALLLVPAVGAAHTTAAAGDSRTPGQRGEVFRDMARATSGACNGVYRMANGLCTHGPDTAPPGVDVTKIPTTAQLRAAAPSPVAALAPSGVALTPGTSTPPTDGSGAVVCDGDGTSGKRVQVLYVVPADKTDRLSSIIDTLGGYAVKADTQLNASAKQTGGVRHFRFVTNADGAGGCTLSITKVAISSTDDDSFSASTTALKNLGFNRADRKYLMFTESNVYCGIGSLYLDDQASQSNANNGSYAQYARVDAGCWNYAESHELMHNLGAVQRSAPHATTNLHCFDESDRMCYDDGSGVAMQQICASANEQYFDCNHDDYFNTSPAAGSYLASYWNSANSAFLLGASLTTDTTAPAVPAGLTASGGSRQVALGWTANGEADLAGYRLLRNGTQIASLGKVTSYTDTGLADGTTYQYALAAVDTAGNVSAASAPVSATTSATASPITETLSGSFSRSKTAVTYSRQSGAGPVSAVVKGTSTVKGRTVAQTVTLTVRNSAGVTVASQSGSSFTLSATLPAAGTYQYTVSGASGTSYSITLTRPA